ncbi:unnamed protein product [Phytophthora fragariaefolia]|uniref:Unnamed protein product n=1 Tax=Phytophthora fragariaefolia TaxID=1490495 RepID=A0A9W6XMI0_9STRA|nr:unnamed protein product [Phytophthora fragariaefolia]
METKSHVEGLTAEHIKSHLQKYRINYERSRLEVQKLNERHAKRSLKRHHHRHGAYRHEVPDAKTGSGSASVSIEGTSTSGQKTAEAATMTLPQDPSQQWNTCDALLLEDTASEQQMHSTMQQRMDFHRELLLTRSVEFTASSSWAARMSSIYGGDSNPYRTGNDASYYEKHEQDSCNSSFLQAWANAEQLRQQEQQVYGRIHEQQQNLFLQQTSYMQDPAPVIPFATRKPPTDIAQTESTGADDVVDLASWSRLSLTVDPDDDDIFGFLRS